MHTIGTEKLDIVRDVYFTGMRWMSELLDISGYPKWSEIPYDGNSPAHLCNAILAASARFEKPFPCVGSPYLEHALEGVRIALLERARDVGGRWIREVYDSFESGSKERRELLCADLPYAERFCYEFPEFGSPEERDAAHRAAAEALCSLRDTVFTAVADESQTPLGYRGTYEPGIEFGKKRSEECVRARPEEGESR